MTPGAHWQDGVVLDPSVPVVLPDAVLLMSFGGPEGPDEVMPFLRRVTGGRGIPDDRLAVVAEHYLARGGVSPINQQNRELKEALTTELARREVEVEVLWGNRNAAPFVGDVLAEAADRGVRHVVMVTTSAYPSYSSCRQYREDLAAAAAPGQRVDRIGPYALSPGFLAASTNSLAAALTELAADGAQGAAPHVLFVTHSVPTAMAESSGPGCRPAEGSYVSWHRAVGDRVLAGARRNWPGVTGELVYCSRSGAPHQPWLEPDVNDRLRELAADPDARDRPVVLAPIGFVSDHMEVIHDLDTEALATAAEVGLRCVRAATVGTDPAFVTQLVDEVLARAALGDGLLPDAEAAASGPGWTHCPSDCCVNVRAPQTPAIS